MKHTPCTLLVTIAALCFTAVSTLDLEYKAKYYTNTTLICDDKALKLPYTVYKIYWATPNGRFFNWDYPGDSKYTIGEAPYFNLTIDTINDNDFGWYYCIILWDNYIYLTNSIKVGLNVHGADYSDLYPVYQQNLVIGGIAACGTAVVITLCCLVYWCRNSEINTVNKLKKPKKYGKANTSMFCKSSPSSFSSSSVSSSPMSSRRDSSDVQAAIYVLDKAVKDFDESYSCPRTSETTTNAEVGFNIRRLSFFKGEDSMLDISSDSSLPPPPPNMLPPSPLPPLVLSPIPTLMSSPKPIMSPLSSSLPLSPQVMLSSPTTKLAPSSSISIKSSSPTTLTSPITEHRRMTEAFETYDMVMGDLRNYIVQKANEDMEELAETYDKPDDQQIYIYANPVKRADGGKADSESTTIGVDDIVDSSEFQDQIADEVF